MIARSEEGWCPICGKKRASEHRCSPASLAGIDAANTRAMHEGERLADEACRPEGERLYAGARLLAWYRDGKNPGD